MTNLVKLPQININNYASYVASIKTIPMLDVAEEKSLVTQFYEKNDLQAAQKLVYHHLYLVIKAVHKYTGYGLPSEDLAQEGTIGLMKAVKRFNPMQGARLASYAIVWIESEIKEYIIGKLKMIKGSTSKAFRKLFFNYRSSINELNNKNEGLTQSEKEVIIANKLDVSQEDIKEAVEYFSQEHVNMQINPDNGEESVIDIPVENTDIEYLENHEEYLERKGKFNQALKVLNPREKEILMDRRINNIGLQELAQKHAISIERVRQIENQAFKKIQSTIEQTETQKEAELVS